MVWIPRIPSWKGLLLRGIPRIPNHQLAVSWIKPTPKKNPPGFIQASQGPCKTNPQPLAATIHFLVNPGVQKDSGLKVRETNRLHTNDTTGILMTLRPMWHLFLLVFDLFNPLSLSLTDPQKAVFRLHWNTFKMPKMPRFWGDPSFPWKRANASTAVSM